MILSHPVFNDPAGSGKLYETMKIIPIIILAIAAGFWSCKSGPDEEKGKAGGQRIMTVGGLVLQPRILENRILSTGTLLANEEVILKSEMPGRIIAINFVEGTFVEKGSLLVKIEDDELQAQLRKLQFEEKQAGDDLYRKEKLLELKAVSQEEYDRAENLLGITRSQIQLIRSQIANTEIYAPFSGHIGLRQVSPGEFVSSSTQVARLLQTDPVKIDFAVPEKYRDKVKKGTPVTFRVESSDSLFSGKVYAIEPRVDPSTRNIMLRAQCANRQNILVPGSFARVELILETIPDALVLPSQVIIPQLNGEKVLVCSMGKAVSRVVKTGVRTEREVQIVSGLEAGDTVITSGLLQLRDQMPVKIKLP